MGLDVLEGDCAEPGDGAAVGSGGTGGRRRAASRGSLLYGGHPYRHFNGGTVAGLSSITLDDVKAHGASVFTQDRLVVGLAGAVDEKLETR